MSQAFVPVPPSKAKTDEMYDDRVTRMLLQVRPTPPLDVRELIVQKQSTDAFHESEERRSPRDLAARYELDSSISSEPVEARVFDEAVVASWMPFT